MYQEINILEVLEEREKRQKKVDDLKQQYEAEISLVIQKHKSVLDEFEAASEKMKRQQEEFRQKWNPRLSVYNNEVKKIRLKYKRLARAI